MCSLVGAHDRACTASVAAASTRCHCAGLRCTRIGTSHGDAVVSTGARSRSTTGPLQGGAFVQAQHTFFLYLQNFRSPAPQFLQDEGLYETREELERREDVLGRLSELAQVYS